MKTVFDAVEKVYEILDVQELKTLTQGEVYRKGERPSNSTKTDVTVTSLSSSEGLVSDTIINVNLYAQDIKKKGSESYYEVPANEILKLGTTKIVELLKGNIGKFWNDGNLFIENIFGPLSEEKVKQHFINIRVKVKFRANYN